MIAKMTNQNINSSQEIRPQIEKGWLSELYNEFQAPYFRDLKSFLVEEKKKYRIYPPGSEIFAAFNNAPFDKVRVVILGQDPYHGAGQANGLCFSVKKGIPFPPSLRNIFKELKSDLGIPEPKHGDLTPWAKQGVLLLNATLTVRAGQAGSHQGKGWEQFTDQAIRLLSEKRENLVFILWGKYAQAKKEMIDWRKHLILQAPHPSPFSADRGFFGSRPFSQTNDFFKMKGLPEIDWRLD
ncbi:MAG: uracil-DNA glycosylase [Bacteroidales bacterium]